MRAPSAPSMTVGVPFIVVDAFTTQPFKGNPAVVMILPPSESSDSLYPVADDTLQAMAMQFNITESAFLVPISSGDARKSPCYQLRWFSPLQEIRLCGHATLASAYVLLNGHTGHHACGADEVSFFTTWSGQLKAKKLRDGARGTGGTMSTKGSDRIEIELPAGTPTPVTASLRERVENAVVRCAKGLEGKILDVLAEKDVQEGGHPAFKEYVMAILDPSVDLKALDVNPSEFIPLNPLRLVILTNRKSGSTAGYYIRVFCPLWGVPEDPVCGSANCLVAGYWAQNLGRSLDGVEMSSSQVSRRGGELGVVWNQAKKTVKLRGSARVSVQGEILL